MFEGVSNAADMGEIMDLLQENEMSATFFFSGLDVLNDPDSVSLPLDEGFSIGNNGYSANSKMESFSQKTVISEICRAAVLIESVAGDQPTQLLFRQTEYTDEILTAAYACNIDSAIQPDCYIGQNTIASLEQAQQLINQIPRGSIICIRLSGVLNTEEESVARGLLSSAAEMAKEDGNDASSQSSDDASAQAAGTEQEETAAGADILQITQWIIDSLKQTDLGAESETLIAQNGGAMEDSTTSLNTTARMVAFTFSGWAAIRNLSICSTRWTASMQRRCFLSTATKWRKMRTRFS